MYLDAAVLGLVSSLVGTLVVIVGALAAVRQVRHLRQGNELSAMAALEREWQSEPMRVAREFVRTELVEALHDPTFLGELRSSPMGPRGQLVQRVSNFLERLAIFVHVNALSRRMVLLLWGPTIVGYWEVLREAVSVIRSGRPFIVLNYFEDLAMRMPDWQRGDERRRGRLLSDPRTEASRAAPNSQTP